MVPDRLIICDNASVLRIVWRDGHQDEITAALLRQESRSAGSRRAEIDNRTRQAGNVKIEAIDPIGAYAVNIAFSDGEHRGIYPWSYLAELAAREKRERWLTASDFMIEGEPA